MTENIGIGGLRRIADRRAEGWRRRQRNRRFGDARAKGGDRMQWVGMVAVSLPGLAALAALLFTWMQVGQANKELRISEQGQITNRFNAAINNLGSKSLDVRLGGIYALQRIMQDSSRDQRTVVSVLSAYVRQHVPVPASGFKSAEEQYTTATDVSAVIAVLGNRPASQDVTREGTPLYPVNLSHVDLRGLRPEVGLKEGSVAGNFRFANLTGADLRFADLSAFNLFSAGLGGANLENASLIGANVKSAGLEGANLKGADLEGANLSEALLDTAVLANTKLRGADLTDADLRRADLRGADFTGAHLTGAKLNGAKLDGARGLAPSTR
ncbi:pentapeptide repeat-containing protein [Streptomyces lydicus]|uniref:pentapeptide repeat-containing protein n=1 Tax=Streptomyces lydicus TaxID=47763 RepID=UPI0037A0B005